MLVMDSLDPVVEKQESGKVVDACHRFARKRFESEYLWKPSAEIENALIEAIFGMG